MSIGSQLRKLRESVGITQRSLAIKIGCSQPHLCNVERGRSTPSEAMIAKVRKQCANGKTNGLGKASKKAPKSKSSK